MIVFKYITHPIEASMNQRIEYNVVEFSEEAKSAFRKSLEASFIGSEKEPDDRFAPRILSNNDPASNVLSVIKGEFLDCVSFDLSVAFITASGIQVLAEILSQLRQRGIKGRILTSTYLCFNDPDALRKLLEYPNIETRVYQGDLHAKGYFFNKRGISTIIIGSSNLTQTALTCNKEWNVLFRSFPTGDIAHKTKAEFEKLWTDENTANLDTHWIESYEKFLAEKPASTAPARRKFYIAGMSEGSSPSGDDRATKIKPNKMQTHALEALDVLHQRNDPRALLVSATGTGKTYLSALDVAACAQNACSSSRIGSESSTPRWKASGAFSATGIPMVNLPTRANETQHVFSPWSFRFPRNSTSSRPMISITSSSMKHIGQEPIVTKRYLTILSQNSFLE